MYKRTISTFAIISLLIASILCIAQASFRFVTMADSQGSSTSNPDPGTEFTQIINQVNALSPRPDFWVFGGDAYYEAADSSDAIVHWNTWKSKISAIADIPVYLAIGNHDANVYYHDWDGAGPFRASWPTLPNNGPTGFVGVTYSFRCDNSIFIILDTDVYDDASRVNAVQRDWLRAILDTTTATHKFVFGHEEAFPPSDGGGHSSLQDNPADRDSLWNILTSHHVDAYICGHIHLWNDDFFVASGHGNRPADYSVRQVINGGAGGSIVSGYGGDFSHYVVWDIDAESVAARIYDNTGMKRDSIIYAVTVGIDENVQNTAGENSIYLQSDYIHWTGLDGIATVNIYDIRGEKVWSGETDNSYIYLGENGAKLPNGVYLVSAMNNRSGKIVRGKIVLVR